MAESTDTPILDLLTSMTEDSIERGSSPTCRREPAASAKR